MKKVIAIITLSVLTLSVAPFVFAQETDITSKPVISTVGDLMVFANKIINWLFTALLITAVVFIIISAFGWLTAGGDPAKTSTARNQLIYALVAVVIGALAKGLVLMVGNLLGVRIGF